MNYFSHFSRSTISLMGTLLLLSACADSLPISPSGVENNTKVNSLQSLQSVDVDNVPTYALKPANTNVGLTGQLKIPANLILGPDELGQLTAPPQGLTAPPQGLTAPPQGLTAPPQGILPAQSIFGIRSLKSQALATSFWVEFFRDNFKISVSETGSVQDATINQTVIQFINGQPFFVASYVLPQLKPNANYDLRAEHPLLNLQTRLTTAGAGQTMAADLDLGSTTVKLVKEEAARQNKQVNLAYLNAHIQGLEATVADALQKRFKSAADQALINQAVQNFVSALPEYVAPQAIQIQESVKTLKVGQPVAYSAVTTFADQTQTLAVSWSTSAGDVASIQADGTLLGLQPGQVELEARALDDSLLSHKITINIVP
jgi:hypothetical protein